MCILGSQMTQVKYQMKLVVPAYNIVGWLLTTVDNSENSFLHTKPYLYFLTHALPQLILCVCCTCSPMGKVNKGIVMYVNRKTWFRSYLIVAITVI